MDICNKCFQPGRIVKPGLRCLKCVSEKKKEWKRKKSDKKCSYCKKPFIPNGIACECSLKCKLLNRFKEVNGCWEWQGKITNVGYGEITHNRKYMLAHRCSYRTFIGEIPEGKVVCHSCDNKKCINPDHLWIGTQKDNIQDCKIKGRLPDQRGRKQSQQTIEKLKFRKHSDRRGEKHHLGKLTNDDVLKIRDLNKQGLTNTEISKQFNVDPSHISNIVNRKSWTHV